MFKHELGVKAKCKITQLTGIITARSEHITGCNRYMIEPPVDKDGKLTDRMWIDEDIIEILDKKPIIQKTAPAGPSAG